MKYVKYLFLSLLLITSPSYIFAANSSVTQSMVVSGTGDNVIAKVTIAWVADDTDGSVPSTALTSAYTTYFHNWVCFFAVTDPGGTAPQALYDIVINDAYSMDIFGGALADRSATLSQQSLPLIATSTYGPRVVDTALTFVLTNNNVNSATGTLVLYFAKRWIR